MRTILWAIIGCSLALPVSESQAQMPQCNGVKPKTFNAEKKNVTTKTCTDRGQENRKWECVTGYDMYLKRTLCVEPPREREKRKKHCTETGGPWFIEEYRNGDCGATVGVCKAPAKLEKLKEGGKNAVVTDACTEN